MDVTQNVLYRSERRIISYEQFPDVFKRELLADDSYGLLYGHLSTSPSSLLREMIVYAYRAAGPVGADPPPLEEVASVKLRRASSTSRSSVESPCV